MKFPYQNIMLAQRYVSLSSRLFCPLRIMASLTTEQLTLMLNTINDGIVSMGVGMGFFTKSTFNKFWTVFLSRAAVF